MIETNISNEMILYARDKAIELGKLNNSILNGGGNFAGFLGEVLANSYLKGSFVNTMNYDIVLNDGTKVDVKSKQTTVIPKEDYECSVAKYNTKQECDIYLFTRIKKDLSKGWLLGWLYKKEYFEKARFLKKGEVDGSNKFTVRADCYNVFIKDLKDIREIPNG